MIAEKKLTPAEKKKREEIARAIERDNPDMPMSKKMAIATAQAKKVAESMMREKKRLLLTDEDLEEGSPSFNYAVAKATVEEPEKNFVKIGGKNIRKTMDMKTARKIVKEFESEQNEEVEINEELVVEVKRNPPRHKYAYIVEKVLNLEEQSLVHYKGFPGWPQGTWGKDWENHGFQNGEGRNQPIMVHSSIVGKIKNLHGAARRSQFALVFSIPNPRSGRDGSSNFKNGKGLIFIYEGSNFNEDAADFSIALIEQGFMKINWAPNWLRKPCILTEYTGSGGLHLGTTDNSSFRNGPTYNLHKRKFKLGSGAGQSAHRLFYYDDVRYPSIETKGFYGVQARRNFAKGVGGLGRYSKKLSYGDYKYDIYGDDTSTPPFDNSERFIGALVSNSPQLGSQRKLTRDQSIDVGQIKRRFGLGVQQPKPEPVSTTSEPADRNNRPSSSEDELNAYGDYLLGTPTTPTPTSQSTSSSSETTSEVDREKVKNLVSEINDIASDHNINIRDITTSNLYNVPPEDLIELRSIVLRTAADNIQNLAKTNNIDIRTITTNNLYRLTSDDLVSVRKKLEQSISQNQGQAVGLLSTLIGSFLTTQWNNIKSRFGQEVQQTSEDALAQAMQLLKDAANPNSAIGKKIYTKQNITIAALLAASVSGFFFIRRFLRDRRQRELSKYVYGDFGARRELQQIARRSGLDKVPQRELMTMLPELERYELSSPQVRRLYDL